MVKYKTITIQKFISKFDEFQYFENKSLVDVLNKLVELRPDQITFVEDKHGDATIVLQDVIRGIRIKTEKKCIIRETSLIKKIFVDYNEAGSLRIYFIINENKLITLVPFDGQYQVEDVDTGVPSLQQLAASVVYNRNYDYGTQIKNNDDQYIYDYFKPKFKGGRYKTKKYKNVKMRRSQKTTSK
jgi:hypothetical protein